MSWARRVSSLDGLRGIAAISVMAFHFDVFFLPHARLSHLVPFLGRAYLAVDLFFLLSGFIMAHVYGRLLASNWRTHWRHFAFARFARLYPLFMITTLAMVLLVVVYRAPTEDVSFSGRSLALQPALLQQWYSGLSWNYPSWSISTEAEAYFFFVFFAGLLVAGRRPYFVAACCIAVLAMLGVRNGGSLNYFYGVCALLRTLAEFSLGVLLYRSFLSRTVYKGKLSGFLAVGFLALSAVTRADYVAVCGLAFIIYYCADATHLLARSLEIRPLVTLGNWSYSVYLWHVPVSCAIMVAFSAGHHPVSELDTSHARLLLLTTAVAVVTIAALHYRYVEKPMRRLVLRASEASLFEGELVDREIARRPGVGNSIKSMR